jgi:glycosyltransferase involved in cell wall biosynthesis
MKVLLVSTNYGGGAAIACRRHHAALLNAGIDSTLLVLDHVGQPEEKNIISIEDILTKKYGAWYFRMLKFTNRILNKLPLNFNRNIYINGPESVFRIDKLEVFKNADIVHLHWVPKIISYKHVFSDKKKVFFWTQHDMNAFTGGNHYTLDNDYGPYKLLLDKNIQRKIAYLKDCNLTITPTSNWLAQLAKESEVFKPFDVKVVAACVDSNIFKTIDKDEAFAQLGIKRNSAKKYILFVAEKTDDIRKGMGLLLSALSKIKNKSKICVLVIGKKSSDLQLDFEIIQLGFKRKAEELVACYNAADFFVIPSIEDNLPNTVLESLSCGTPVLGFNIGGIPDMVVNYHTGILSAMNDENMFVENIDTFVELDNYNGYAENCRNMIAEKFSEKKLIERILPMYQSKMINN